MTAIKKKKSQLGRGHGGNIHLLSRENQDKPIIDFSANINPLGPPAWLRSTISRALSSITHYPDPDCYALNLAISEHYDIDVECVIAANGSTEILYLLPKILSFKRAVIPVPSYIDYQKVMELHNKEIVHFQLREKDNFSPDLPALSDLIKKEDVVILGSPNNPTATVVASDTILEMAENHPDSWFVIDEAFIEFLPDQHSVACQCDNIMTLNSLTKFYALPGLRLGFGTFPRHLADALRHQMPPWSVNTLAQIVGAQVFSDKSYRQKSIRNIKTLREDFLQKLQKFKCLYVYPSEVNYFLIKINGSLSASELAKKLLEEQIAIRVCENYESLDDRYFRLAIRTEEENNRVIEVLNKVFQISPSARKKNAGKTPSLMIQGTSSNAGKSVIVAALCRILIEDGVRVAPFKAQNMSLNSFVTHDGLEMGRAQVVQAQAAKLDPDVRMNPVLLKPNSDIGSQVIVHGKPVGNMSVSQYVRYKKEAWAKVQQSYDSISSEFDAIVLEGAGSPGEVNLKHHDIVNMRMAEYARSPVLLIGDIDRGGVYASFIGTMEVMEEWERNLVSGFLVNRFRGDASLLQSAHDYIVNFTGRPVLGTIPYIKELGIPEEDSVSFKAGKLQKSRPQKDYVEIALINLPHISNFTDIEPFLEEPDVYLKIVKSVEELADPQAVILPGSKNVIGDLEYLRKSGFADALIKYVENGGEIIGICGGYQILGNTICDPYSIESDDKTLPGLRLLDINTTLAPEKTLTRQQGIHLPSTTLVYGYEIHHGLSNGNTSPLLQFDDKSTCGAIHPHLPIWGAYLHGIFDSDPFRRWFIDNLREKKNLQRIGKVLAPYDLEFAFNNLAEVVRNSIEMEDVYQLLGV